MIKALVNKKIVYAINAESGMIGECPHCGNPVRARCGEINVEHWAHIDNECPYITEKDTKWHIAWKSKFEKKGYETEKRFGNFIADAFNSKTNTILEFQHSSMTPQEIRNRCNYYKNINKNIKWIFDFTEKYKKAHIELTEKYKDNEDGFYYNFKINWQRKRIIEGVTRITEKTTKPSVPIYFNLIYNYDIKNYAQLRVIKNFDEYKSEMYSNRYRNYCGNLNDSMYKIDIDETSTTHNCDNVLAEISYNVNDAVLLNPQKISRNGTYGWGYLIFL